MNFKYADIIDKCRPDPILKPMDPLSRAAQFSAFAALDGYDECVLNASDVLDQKVELSSDQADDLNKKLNLLFSKDLKHYPAQITVTFFKKAKSQKKGGIFILGRYETKILKIKAIDGFKKEMKTTCDEIIPFDDIKELSGEFFDEMEDF